MQSKSEPFSFDAASAASPKVTVCTNRETYAAKALFIDGCGQLVVERENGRTVALRHGEVSIRPARTT